MVQLLRKSRTGYLGRKSNPGRRAANSAGTKVASTTASLSRGNCERTGLLVAAELVILPISKRHTLAIGGYPEGQSQIYGWLIKHL